MVEDDTNIMNKYRINFYSLTCQYSVKWAKTDFYNFAKKLYPTNIKDLEEFKNEYQINVTGE